MKDKKEIQLDNVSLKESVSTSFALMLEQTNGTYEETTDTEWPSEGYSFNKHMSGCIDSNGNTIENTLTYKNGTIKLKTKHNTYCYIYFDIDRPATEELLATVPEEQLWDSTLEDDGYRYVGTNPDNYICFGTTDQEECMNDTDKYMYRIIGIFENSEGQQHLKLIKKEALNTAYAWNPEHKDVDWDESDLYKGINGSYFATNSEYFYMQDSTWNSMITNWDYILTNALTFSTPHGPYYHFTPTQAMYIHELNRNGKTSQICYYDSSTIADCGVGEWKEVNLKIGLMYASDYQLSLGEKSLNYTGNTHRELLQTGWMHLINNDGGAPSKYEWTMTRVGDEGTGWYIAWFIFPDGNVTVGGITDQTSVRPVFYLESNTKLDKGTGTIDNPYIIETSPNLREYCEEYNNINECIQNEEKNIEEVKDLWNSTLESDGIRYVGTNPNNYVCFGTTNTSECITDTDKYMYRIIGIFEDSEGQQHLKLIKKEDLNTAYAWNSDYQTNIDWEDSDLYKGINGSYFATNTIYSYMQNNIWLNKITTWEYTATNTLIENSGPDYYNAMTSQEIYLHEMNRSSKTSTVGEWKSLKCKISLMYVSDYLLSLGKEALNYTSFSNAQKLKLSWIHMNNNENTILNNIEWFITFTNVLNDNRAWSIHIYGNIDDYRIDNIASVRPVFYLTENIKITSGKGSITEPFIIN